MLLNRRCTPIDWPNVGKQTNGAGFGGVTQVAETNIMLYIYRIRGLRGVFNTCMLEETETQIISERGI